MLTVSALLAVAVGVALALVAWHVARRVVRPAQVAAAQPTAEVVMEAMAGLYGVLLAFILAGAWQRLGDTRANLALEANALADLRRTARLLPAPLGDRLGAEVEAYRVRAVEELPLAADGRTSPAVDSTQERLWRTLTDFAPATPGESALQSHAFDALTELEDQRRLRLAAQRRALPPLLWVILIGGAAAVLGLVAVSSAGERLPALYLALLAAVISFALYATYAMAYPLRSGLATDLLPALRDATPAPTAHAPTPPASPGPSGRRRD
ncbi:MAG: DUF4239 domain-containing protein [Gemmatimonadetes bacterium]|nr:DUF4239 domain-containing protein [Gemmatimonadota bacterium]